MAGGHELRAGTTPWVLLTLWQLLLFLVQDHGI